LPGGDGELALGHRAHAFRVLIRGSTRRAGGECEQCRGAGCGGRDETRGAGHGGLLRDGGEARRRRGLTDRADRSTVYEILRTSPALPVTGGHTSSAARGE